MHDLIGAYQRLDRIYQNRVWEPEIFCPSHPPDYLTHATLANPVSDDLH